MNSYFDSSIQKAITFSDHMNLVISALEDAVSARGDRVVYLSGTVSSDGDEFIERNKLIMSEIAQSLRSEKGIRVLNPAECFSLDFELSLHENGHTQENMRNFWVEVLRHNKRFINEMYMAPEWQRSKGATLEHQTALELGFLINYL